MYLCIYIKCVQWQTKIGRGIEIKRNVCVQWQTKIDRGVEIKRNL